MWNALPTGRDVACHSFSKNRSDDIDSLGMWISIDFLRVRIDIPWLVGGDEDLCSFLKGTLETLQGRSRKSNALLKCASE